MTECQCFSLCVYSCFQQIFDVEFLQKTASLHECKYTYSETYYDLCLNEVQDFFRYGLQSALYVNYNVT